MGADGRLCVFLRNEREEQAIIIAIFKNSAHQHGIFVICSLRMLLVH